MAWFDAAIPGTLPVLNEQCVAHAVRAGIALKGTVNRVSVFERKHYFYCDLPLGWGCRRAATSALIAKSRACTHSRAQVPDNATPTPDCDEWGARL